MAKRTSLYPLGVTLTEYGAEILVQSRANQMTLLVFHAGENEPAERIPFDSDEKIGDVWRMSLERADFEQMEYGFEADAEWMTDPCAKAFAGRHVWGMFQKDRKTRARLPRMEFDWGEDKNPGIPYSESVIYRLHVRGFTRHESSWVKNKGTYAGIAEMIPYIKSLGVTAVELMPVTDFDELASPDGQINFWGYGPSYLYAPKASYGTGMIPVEQEFKSMVKELHHSGLECILEFYFTGEEAPGEVLNVLRYWVEEYHVDGFKLSGDVPLELIADSPFLSNTKFFAENWGHVLERHSEMQNGKQNGKKLLAEYRDEFEHTMRSVLRGDQNIVEPLMSWTMKNPENYAVINYMANTNGFTMMDMVSYHEKHNEANGENNRDGADENYSWNCGVEGETENEGILKLRKRQLRNAYMLLLLSQGTPLILAGDEFGNTQNGNNNAYCQDNEIGWINWETLKKNMDVLQFVKELIEFRKAHKVLHMDHAAKFSDYRSLGCPDVSYHGQSAWKPDEEYFRKQLGIMYWGPYETKEGGTLEDTIYVAYNMHWGTHYLGLPRLPQGYEWKPVLDTSAGGAVVKNRLRAQIPPHSVSVFAAVVTLEAFDMEES